MHDTLQLRSTARITSFGDPTFSTEPADPKPIVKSRPPASAPMPWEVRVRLDGASGGATAERKQSAVLEILGKVVALPESSEEEIALEEKVSTLWGKHRPAKEAARRSNQELKAQRLELARDLYGLKGLYAKPGRSGRWIGFLREHSIPVSTADRLVAAHKRKLEEGDLNLLIEQITEPTSDVIAALVKPLVRKVRPVLMTKASVDEFLAQLTRQLKGVG